MMPRSEYTEENDDDFDEEKKVFSAESHKAAEQCQK